MASGEFKGWVMTITPDTVTVRCGIIVRSYQLKYDGRIFDFVSISDDTITTLSTSLIPAFDHDYETPTLIALCRAELVKCARLQLESAGLVEVFPPVLLRSQIAPIDDELIQLPNGQLSQTSQGHLEQWAPIVGNCYCLGRSFRQVSQPTNRHLTEFLHLEVEWIGVVTLDDLVHRVRTFIVELITTFSQRAAGYLTQLGIDLSLKDLSCPIIDEAQVPTQLSLILNPERSSASFDLKPGMAVDVVVPVMGEIMGCGIREYDPDDLAQAILEAGKTLDQYSEYMSLRVMGHGRTAGFGLGVDRLLAWLLDRSDIRAVV